MVLRHVLICLLSNLEALEITLEVIKWILVAIVGLCVGSFLNVVIYRLPNGINLAKPRSFCPTCNHKLAWYDNIPVFAWLFLKGKCRYCGTKISPRYMVVELLTMGLWLLTYYYFGHYNISICIVTFIVISCFIAIFFIDAKHYIIPDSLVLIIGGCGLVSVIMSAITETGIIPLEWSFNIYFSSISIGWAERLIGLGITVVIYLIVSLIEKLLNREIIGGGDLKLFAAVSLFLGARLLLLGIFFGAVFALLVELPFASLLKRNTDEEGGGAILPFGPYLTLGFTVALFYGLPLINLYLGLFSI
ncbi:MAG: prepilin peptidase [Bacilli bacterium]|nr:prepilin peptidase [Bacilli bacterium]